VTAPSLPQTAVNESTTPSISNTVTTAKAAADAQTFGIIMGTLGRQGNPAIVQRLCQVLRKHEKSYFVMLVSEITPVKLKLLPSIHVWVQVACPRLSVDWGQFLSDKPVLNPYELFVAMGEEEWKEVYPMDYYSQAGGPWTNYYETNRERRMTAKET
jgi:2-(3-amino-3-carboxypropyl)histidine synthase